MRLSPEEIKKVAASLIFGVILYYCYQTFLLGPLEAKGKGMTDQIAKIEPLLREAQVEIGRIAALESQVPRVEDILVEVDGMIPYGAPVAWFPARLNDRFKRHDVTGAVIRLLGEEGDAALPGYKRLLWGVDLPAINILEFGFALTGLENEELLVQVTRLTAEAIPQDPGHQRVSMNLRTIVRK